MIAFYYALAASGPTLTSPDASTKVWGLTPQFAMAGTGRASGATPANGPETRTEVQGVDSPSFSTIGLSKKPAVFPRFPEVF